MNPATPGYNFLNGFKSQIWRFDAITAKGHNDFYQSSPAQPELLLADTISILSGKYFGSNYNQQWVRDLAFSAGYTQVSGTCPSTYTQYYNGTYCTDSNMFLPDFGRFYNPTGIQTNSIPVSTLAGGVVGGIVGGVFVGLLLIAIAVWYIGRKRTLAGVDKTGQSPFAWVRDVAAGRRFATLEEEGVTTGVNERIEITHASRAGNTIHGGSLGAESA
ncbi:UNVERIFIED_CONTAM: hypothetical protein HDU68_004988 [Siphonaria sp. JEL0065]|nr:hypothetical protein HDU68_004988 [Siphonaria sp. JEL0065]